MRFKEELRIRTEVRKWGHSLGVILPKELIRKHGIRERQLVEVGIKKQDAIKPLFGSLKSTVPTRKIKEELKKEWEE